MDLKTQLSEVKDQRLKVQTLSKQITHSFSSEIIPRVAKYSTRNLSPRLESQDKLQQSQGDITIVNRDQEKDLQRVVDYLQKQPMNWVSEKRQIE